MNDCGPPTDNKTQQTFLVWLDGGVGHIPYIVPWGRTRVGFLPGVTGIDAAQFEAIIAKSKADYEAMRRTFTRERPVANPGSKQHRRALRRALKRRAA